MVSGAKDEPDNCWLSLDEAENRREWYIRTSLELVVRPDRRLRAVENAPDVVKNLSEIKGLLLCQAAENPNRLFSKIVYCKNRFKTKSKCSYNSHYLDMHTTNFLKKKMFSLFQSTHTIFKARIFGFRN